MVYFTVTVLFLYLCFWKFCFNICCCCFFLALSTVSAVAKKLFDSSENTVNYARLSEDILLGGNKTIGLSDSDRQTIGIAKGVPVDDVPVIGWCSRSLWKPEHSYEGLLYRVREHVIYADPDKETLLFYLIVCFLSELTLCRLFSARENILNMMEKQKLVSDKYAQQMTQSYLKLHFSAERSCSLQGMTMMMTSRII